MNSDDILKGRLHDLADAAYTQNRYTYTNFLSASDMEVFYRCESGLSPSGYEIFGGREECDRVMIAFGCEELLGYKCDFPIAAIKVSALIDKFSDDLSHRDFLGALMNLGIEREMIGDILVAQSSSGKHSFAYIFCVNRVAGYITDNLTRIKHTNVKCALCSADDAQDIRTKKESIHIIAASARIDAVIASLTGLSRSNTSSLFRDKSVSLGHRIYENSSYQLKPGDIFSVKGYGKYEFVQSGAATRKGRLNIDLLRYV